MTEKSGFTPGRLLPLLVLVAGFALFFMSGGTDYVSFEYFRDNRSTLLDAVEGNRVSAALLFIVLYTLATAFSLPGGSILTLGAGFLFGIVGGSIFVIVGATAGSTVLFLIARTALGEPLRARASGTIARMEDGFRDNAWSYMLFLRLVPVFPFWLVNLVPAFAGVGVRCFVVTTFFGIIPGTVVYASIGNSLGVVFDRGGVPDLTIIFDPEILLPLVALAGLSLVPVVYKKISGKKG